MNKKNSLNNRHIGGMVNTGYHTIETDAYNNAELDKAREHVQEEVKELSDAQNDYTEAQRKAMDHKNRMYMGTGMGMEVTSEMEDTSARRD